MRYVGAGMYGMQAPLWVSGATIAQYQLVTSPADKETYQRIASTGSGTTDPADDTTNYVAVSYERLAAIVGGGVINSVGNFTSIGNGPTTKTTLAAIGVSARTSVLSVSGRGCVDYFAFFKNAAGTTRVEIIVDGRTLFDQTDTYGTTNALIAIGMISAGSGANALNEARFDPAGVQFRRTLEVYITNTATGSPSSAGIAYHLRSVA